MKKVDKIFLKMFKDLRIEVNSANPDTNGKPNYICFLENRPFSHADVVRMVKSYQDKVISELLLEQQENTED